MPTDQHSIDRLEGRVDPELPATPKQSEHPYVRNRDHALERLELLMDGVYAIALTLLVLELRLPEVAREASGPELLANLLGVWPKLLSYITSFTVVALFWSVNHRMFHYVVRFDGGLRWLSLLQLGLVAIVPFPSAVLGDHLGDPVAQEFYFGTLALTVFVSGAGFWYASWNYRLISNDLNERDIQYYRILSLASFLAFVILLIVIPLGMSRLINPLILGYLMAILIVAFGLLDRAERPRESKEPTGDGTWSH